MSDAIDHPSHYNQGGPIGEDGSAQFEVIKIIEDLGWGFEFCMGNALKYVLRAPHKVAEVEDLKKARWYLERARLHKGSVRANRFRKINIDEASEAWGLHNPGLQDQNLALAVQAISHGDPDVALNYLIAHMSKLASQEAR